MTRGRRSHLDLHTASLMNKHWTHTESEIDRQKLVIDVTKHRKKDGKNIKSESFE